jgi:hypothetical protein
MKRVIVLFLIGLATFSGCSTERSQESLFAPQDVGALVVDALLIVEQPLPDIYLSRATRPDRAFDSLAAAERSATVTVSIVLPGGSRIPYVYSEAPPGGRYQYLGSHNVQPGYTYELEVITAQGEVLTATTRTPPLFSVADWLLLENDGQTIRRGLRTYAELGDSVYYAPENELIYSDGLLEGRFVRQQTPGFQVGLISLDRDSGFVIEPEFFDDDDFASITRVASSPPFLAEDGTIRLPWLAIFFTGRYKIRAMALDRNAYDLIRTTPMDDGSAFAFGGNVGDNFERPLFYVEGGIGLFGSASADSIGVFIQRAP